MKNPHAQALGKIGGSAGRGAAKARTSEQARAAAQARWVKQRLLELEQKRRDISYSHIWNNAMCKGARPAPPDTSALDAEIRKAKEAAGKLFWQRTQSQVAAAIGMPAEKHRRYVEDALKAGKSVPAHVMADYPDLLPNKAIEAQPPIIK